LEGRWDSIVRHGGSHDVIRFSERMKAAISMKNILTRSALAAAVDNFDVVMENGARGDANVDNELRSDRRPRSAEGAGSLFFLPGYGPLRNPAGERSSSRSDEKKALTSTDAAAILRQALRLLRRFSHDIRTPLNSIVGFATLVAEEGTAKSESVRYSGYGRDIAKAGMELLDTTLEHMALLETVVAGAGGQRVPICINSLLGDLLADVKQEAVKRRIITRESLSGALPAAFADGDTVQRLLHSLLQRAVEVTPPYGQIFVATCIAQDGCPIFRIRDGGERLSADQIADLMTLRGGPHPEISTGEGAGERLLRRALTQAEISGARLDIRSLPDRGSVVEVTFRPEDQK
jgi:signal transduction histidine kinase